MTGASENFLFVDCERDVVVPTLTILLVSRLFQGFSLKNSFRPNLF